MQKRPGSATLIFTIPSWFSIRLRKQTNNLFCLFVSERIHWSRHRRRPHSLQELQCSHPAPHQRFLPFGVAQDDRQQVGPGLQQDCKPQQNPQESGPSPLGIFIDFLHVIAGSH